MWYAWHSSVARRSSLPCHTCRIPPIASTISPAWFTFTECEKPSDGHREIVARRMALALPLPPFFLSWSHQSYGPLSSPQFAHESLGPGGDVPGDVASQPVPFIEPMVAHNHPYIMSERISLPGSAPTPTARKELRWDSDLMSQSSSACGRS